MLYVLEMSTDKDIQKTELDAHWGKVEARFKWQDYLDKKVKFPDGSSVIVIAHGGPAEIGNAKPGTVDIDPEKFIEFFQKTSAGYISNVYISVCQTGIADFLASVVNLLDGIDAHALKTAQIFSHTDPASGNVPPSGQIVWTQIFQKHQKRRA